MSIPAETLRTQLRYTAWATSRILDAASKLTAEELARDFGTADKSVLGTLTHTFAADRIWIARVLGAIPARFLELEKDMFLEVLQSDWPKVNEQWLAWAGGLDDEGVKATISYKDLKGNSHTTPAWQIVMHVINHATHHRGQAAGMIRSMGHTPPVLDMIAYYRSLG
ncbi:MAG: DinB family protein [Acidobacteria bacterium]|nr:DinB family protein [Acidobacteriota bacterium]